MNRSKLRNGAIAMAAGSAALAGIAVRRFRASGAYFESKVVLITGGSHGLGVALARRFGAKGAKLALCSRHASDLQAAREDLARFDVLTVPCDVSDPQQCEFLIDAALERFGRIDVLVNNAGVIKVGPVHSMTREDFAEAMDVMFWGAVNTTFAALPHLRRTRGTIVNVTSIGGKLSIPHLLPYCCAKFAEVAFSEGLRAELRSTGVRVVTIVPGLMRTGSHLNALFKGNSANEAAWFALGASTPGVSMSADRAARQIVNATRRGKAEAVLGVPAKILSLFHANFPGLAADLLGFVNRVLPDGNQQHARKWDRATRSKPWLDAIAVLSNSAAREYLQPGATR